MGPLALVGYWEVPWGAWVLALWLLLALPVLICHPLLNNCKPFHCSKHLQDISAFILSPELETICQLIVA